MKKCLLILFVMGPILLAQEALHNYGNLKVHDSGAVGFHNNLINDGISDDNQGLVGFFNSGSSSISGAFRPVFRDMEIMVANDLFLEVGVDITNNTNFVLGDVITQKSDTDITLTYINEAFYNGDEDHAKVNGYAAFTNKENFEFPIGDADQKRSLFISAAANIPNAKSAYFRENPNTPSTFLTNFDTGTKEEALIWVSDQEYWHLEADTPSTIRLTWNEESELRENITDISKLKIVGWHKEKAQWESLEGLEISGDLSTGRITSTSFSPNDYAIITLGSGINDEDFNLSNYLLTPNNDGDNDYLTFEIIAVSPNNELQIFNRWGKLVYSKKNYDNSFDGKANSGIILQNNKRLPDGVYFYIINLHDIDKIHQGYLYLNQ